VRLALLGMLAACAPTDGDRGGAHAAQEPQGGSGADGGSHPADDDDGDGLSNGQEASLGTDPDDPDTDGDGFEDGEEQELGTNPLFAPSRPYEGGYNVGFCAEPPDPTGPTSSDDTYRSGDVAEDFVLTDQHGQDVHLYSFCDRWVMLVFSALWCEPCAEQDARAQWIQDRYGASDFQIVTVLIEDEHGQDLEPADLEGWAAEAGMETVPVLDNSGRAPPWSEFETDATLPTIVHLSPEMEVLSVDEAITDPARFVP